ncbi:MAG: hypothetical protein Q9184_008210, partial [Pyrenodesmia sp. 2 TL-2023]
YGAQYDLDRDCNIRDRADITAYTSFLETRGQPLLDLSLYVSSENYHASTRPAYTNILQWPNTWLLPPKRRAAAKARTDHLNFSSLDLDTRNEDQATKSQFAAGTEIPKLVAQSAQKKASSLMKQPQHAARFRLDSLSESFCEPLAQLQQGKHYLLSDERMTSLDCLALGYLSLALVPEVPQPWLPKLMKSKYPCLCHFVEDLALHCWGVELNGRDGKSPGKATGTTLPWKAPDEQWWLSPIRIRSTLESLPYLGALYRPSALQPSTTTPHEEMARVPVLPTIFATFTASVTALIGYVLYTGEMPSPPAFIRPLIGRQRPQRLPNLGAAGAMLGNIRFRDSPY